MTLAELRAERARLAGEIRRMADLCNPTDGEARDFTAEEQGNWDQLNTDYDACLRRLAIAERAETVDAEPADTRDLEAIPGRADTATAEQRLREINGDPATRTEGPTAEQRSLALDGWFRSESCLAVEPRHVEAAAACGLNLGSRSIVLNLADTNAFRAQQDLCRSAHPHLITRAMSGNLGTTGGFLVPQTFLARLEMATLAYGGMLQTSEVIRTATGEGMAWPAGDDTSNTGEIVGENADNSTEANVAVKQNLLGAYDFSSKMIKVPVSLLQDSALPLDSLIAAMLGERLGRIQNTRYTTGTGDAMPYGIVPESTTGVTSASSTAIDPDEIIDLAHSVDPSYRGNARYMLHDTVCAAIRKLKDGNGNYIWQSGLQAGTPDVLNGYPLTINQDMSSTITSGDTTMLFGDLSSYKVRQVGTVTVTRLNERYAEYRQVAFIAFIRADGLLLDAGTHPVKKLVQV